MRKRIGRAGAKSGFIFLATAFAFGLSGCLAHMRGWTPLQEAAYDGDAAAVQKLLSEGVNPGEIGPNGSDAIRMAMDKHPDVARLLLERCLASESPLRSCPSALEEAALLGDAEMAKGLLVKGADLDAAIAHVQKVLAGYAGANVPNGGLLPELGEIIRRQVELYNQGLALLERLRNAPKPAVAAEPTAPPAEKGAAAPWWSPR
ncbi:MAG TPA: ankyrin repeat domain-containing protein [Elusimicrobiota bacterium]|nr:ankyrin repeat domain-containing protein [Elusimicrobiota bacterium]